MTKDEMIALLKTAQDEIAKWPDWMKGDYSQCRRIDEPLATNEPPEPSGVEDFDEIVRRVDAYEQMFTKTGCLVHESTDLFRWVRQLLALIKSLQSQVLLAKEQRDGLERAVEIHVQENAQLRGEVEGLRLALDQSLAHGVAPCLPDEDERNWIADEPYGENIVMFFHADECSYPSECPELAAYLRAKLTGEEPSSGVAG